MSGVDANLPRWVLASVTNYFENTVNASITPTPAFNVTGYDLHDGDDNRDHIECRVQGPHIKDIPGWTVVEVPLNFLMTFRQIDGSDPYTLDRWLGVYQSALCLPVSINRCGNESSDDNTLVGCLTPKRSKREFIRIDRYGFVTNNTAIQQATVGATIDMWVPLV